VRLLLIAVLGVLAVIGVSLPHAGVRAQDALACDLHAINVVGAHAGTLNLRIGIDGSCDGPGVYEFVFPGGALLRGDTTDGSLHLTQDAPVCGAGLHTVAGRYVSESGDVWQGDLVIENEDGSILEGGADCDVLLQRGLTPVRWQGAAVLVTDAFGPDVPADLVAVWLFDPVAQRWSVWAPGLPDALQGFFLLAPGVTYWFANGGDFEIALRFPAP